jgi:ribosome maturation factor RimP
MENPRNLILQQIDGLVTPILREHGAELVDMAFVHEHGQWVLRFFLDKAGGITLDDCAQISDHIGRALDATDLISQRYSLEVSSPGLDRPLKKEQDFQRFLGERVDVTLFAPIEGRRHFRGNIAAADAGIVTVRDAEGRNFDLPLSGVAKAKLDPEISF